MDWNKFLSAGAEPLKSTEQVEFDEAIQLDVVKPNPVFNNSPVRALQIMEQDEEERENNWHYTKDRLVDRLSDLGTETAGLIFGKHAPLGGFGLFQGRSTQYEQMQGMILNYSGFRKGSGKGGPSALGEAMAYVGDLKRKLHSNGVNVKDSFNLRNILEGTHFTLMDNLGKNFHGRVAEGDAKLLTGMAVMGQVVRHSEKADNTIADTMPIVLDTLKEGGLEFDGPWGRFNNELHQLRRERDLDTTETPLSVNKTMQNRGWLDVDATRIKDWYQKLTGKEAPEDILLDDARKPIFAFLDKVDSLTAKANKAVIWKAMGVNINLDHVNEDGTIAGLREMRESAGAMMRFDRALGLDVAYDNEYEHAENAAVKSIKADMFTKGPTEALKNTGLSDDRLNELTKQYTQKLQPPAPVVPGKTSPFGRYQITTEQGAWEWLRRQAFQDKEVAAAIGVAKGSKRHAWIKSNTEKLDKIALEDDIPPELMAEYRDKVKDARIKATAVSDRRQQEYDWAYAIRHANSIVGGIGQLIHKIPGIGYMGDSLGGIYKQLNAEMYNIPVSERLDESIGQNIVDVLQKNITDTLGFMPCSQDELIEKYLDRAAAGETIPIADQLYTLGGQGMRMFYDLPFIMMKNPAEFAAIGGSLRLYGKAATGVINKVQKATGSKGLGTLTGFALRPHEFIKNMTKPLRDFQSERMLFGMSVGKFKQTLNKMPAPLRDQYWETFKKISNELATSDVEGMVPISNKLKSLESAMGHLIAKAGAQKGLSNKDVHTFAELARKHDVPLEATNLAFATPFGNGRFVDGMVAEHTYIKQQQHFANIEKSIEVQAAGRFGTTAAQSVVNFNNNYRKWVSSPKQRAAKSLRNALNKRGWSTEWVDKHIEAFTAREKYEEATSMDQTIFESAAQYNYEATRRTNFRKRLMDGMRETFGLRTNSLKGLLPKEEATTPEGKARVKQMQQDIEVLENVRNTLDYDGRALGKLGQSRLVPLADNPASEFKEVENGWRTSGGDSHKEAIYNHLARLVYADMDVIGDLAYFFNDSKLAHNLAKLRTRKPTDKHFDVLKKIIKTSEKNSENKLFTDRPPVHKEQVIRQGRDMVAAIKNVAGEHNSMILADLATTAINSHYNMNQNRIFRMKSQRIENQGQCAQASISKARDLMDQLSTKQEKEFAGLSKLPPKELLKREGSSPMVDAAIEVLGIRNHLIDMMVDVGKLTNEEANSMRSKGIDPHVYAKDIYRSDLRKYESATHTVTQNVGKDAPEFSRLNVQRKANTPRITWYDEAQGKRRIIDITTDKDGKTLPLNKRRKEATRRIKEIVTKQPGLKDKVKLVEELTEFDMGMMGLFDAEGSHITSVLQEMLVDVTKARLLNEVGLMQGMIMNRMPREYRTNGKAGDWVYLGPTKRYKGSGESEPVSFQNLTHEQRLHLRREWGTMAGKYVHRRFFDHINSWEDYSTLLSAVSKSMKEGRNEMGKTLGAEYDNIIDTATSNIMDKLSTPGDMPFFKWAGRALRQNLITQSVSTFNKNFMGALTFAHQSGAKLLDPCFWKGFGQKKHLANFDYLLDVFNEHDIYKLKVRGTPEQQQQSLNAEFARKKFSADKIDMLQKFKYCMDHGLIERSDEGIVKGGERQLRPGKRSVGEQRKKDQRNTLRDITRHQEVISHLKNVLETAEQKTPERVYTPKQRAQAERRIIAHTTEMTKLKKEMIKYNFRSNWRDGLDEAWRYIKSGDPKKRGNYSVIKERIGQAYGKVDPRVKWMTFNYLVSEMGLSKQAAVERVKDYHQNYGAVSPGVRKLSNAPLIGSFVPSFPAEAARIIKNGMMENPGRIFSPLISMATANSAALMSQGMMLSDYANITGNESGWEQLRGMLTGLIIPTGHGNFTRFDMTDFTPFGPFMESSSMFKTLTDTMAKDSMLAQAAIPAVNFMSNFVLNTPGMQATQKLATGVDPWSGKVTYQRGLGDGLASLAKSGANLFLPAAVTQTYETVAAWRDSPTSLITQRNIRGVDAALRLVGVRSSTLGKKQQKAHLALGFMNESTRLELIKAYEELPREFKHKVYMLGEHFDARDPEQQQEYKALVDERMKQVGDTLQVGNQKWDMSKSVYSEVEKKKRAAQIFNMLHRNINKTIERIPVSRKLKFARAVKNTWGMDEPEYKHTVLSLSDPRYLASQHDLETLMAVWKEATQMGEKTTDEQFLGDLGAIKGGLLLRMRDLIPRTADRRKQLVRQILDSTKGNLDANLNKLFLQSVGL